MGQALGSCVQSCVCFLFQMPDLRQGNNKMGHVVEKRYTGSDSRTVVAFNTVKFTDN